MSRCRIDEFCDFGQLGVCSIEARMLFVCIWNHPGDYPADLNRLKRDVFPGPSYDDHEVRAMLDELMGNGLVSEVEIQGKRYWIPAMAAIEAHHLIASSATALSQ